ncbi:MAG: CARDB domain-containing protein, partial [Thermoplasmatota archaeon]
LREEAPTGGEGGLVGGAVVTEDLDGDFWDGPWKTEPDPSDETDMEFMIGNHDRGVRIWTRQGENSEGDPNYDEVTSGWLGGHQTYATHAVANVTGSPETEIFIGCSEGYPRSWTGWGGKLYVYTPGGKKLWDYSTGSSRASIFSSPAVTDIQRSKFNPYEEHLDYEVIFGCDNGNLYVMNTEYHSLLWHFDTGGRCVSSPAVCDINDDNEMEIIVGSDSGKIFCFDGDPSDGLDEGIPYPGDGPHQDVIWVYDAEHPIGFSSPVIADIDLDGMLEVVIGDREGHVYCLSAGGMCRKGKSEWPTFHQDNNNTGFYNPDELFFIDLHPRITEPGEMEMPAKQVAPGQTVVYNLTLDFNSLGEYVERTTFNIRIPNSTVPEGWEVWLDTPSDRGNDDPDYIRLLPRESANLSVYLRVPTLVTESKIASIMVRAYNPGDPGLSDFVSLIAVLDMAPGLELQYDHPLTSDPQNPDQLKKAIAIHPGGFYDVDVILKNTGMINDTYQVALAEPPRDVGWNWYFMHNGRLTAEVSMPSRFMVDVYGGSTTSTLTIRAHCPLSSIAGMDIPMLVRATSLASLSNDTAQLTMSDTMHFIVAEDNDLRLDLVPSQAVINPASTLTVDLRITNLCNLDQIKVSLENETMPDGWTVDQFPEPVQVFLGQTRIVPFMITSPGELKAGTVVHVTVKGWVSDHTEIFDMTSMMLEVGQVHEVDSGLFIPDDISLFPGETKEYQMFVSNRGNGEEHISFGGTLPGAGWSLKFFDSVGRLVEGTYLGPWENGEFTFRIEAARKWPMGIETAVIEISTGSHSDYHRLDLTVLQVHGASIMGSEGENLIDEPISLNRMSSLRYRVTNTGNGPDTVHVETIPSSIEEKALPGSLITGITSVSLTEDVGGDLEYRNFSQVLDITKATGRKLYLPVGGTSMMKSTRSPSCGITGMDIRLGAGKSVWIEQVVCVRSGLLEGPRETITFGLEASVPGAQDDLPCTLQIRYPDLVFMSPPEIVGASDIKGYDALEGDRITFLLHIGNIGEILAENVVVQLLVDGRQVTNITLPRVMNSPTDQRTVMLTWEARAGRHVITFSIDPGNSLVELNEGLDVGSGQGNEEKMDLNVKGEGSLSFGIASIILTITGLVLLISISIGVYFYLRRGRQGDI